MDTASNPKATSTPESQQVAITNKLTGAQNCITHSRARDGNLVAIAIAAAAHARTVHRAIRDEVLRGMSVVRSTLSHTRASNTTPQVAAITVNTSAVSST